MCLKSISIRLMLCLFCRLAIQSAFGNMLVFRDLCMVKGPVEGADKKSHAIVMEKLGMMGDKVYGIGVLKAEHCRRILVMVGVYRLQSRGLFR